MGCDFSKQGRMRVAQSRPTVCDPMDCSPPALLSMEFSRQALYWRGLPFPSPSKQGSQ